MTTEKPLPIIDTIRAISRADGTRKRELILEHPSPRKLVRSLPAQEFYYLLKDVGISDSAELLSIATEEQILSCLDLDIWRKDRLDRSRLTEWLTFFLSDDREAAEIVWRSADPETLMLLLVGLIKVHEIEDGEVPDGIEGEVIRTPDGFYAVEILPPHETFENSLARALLDRVIAQGFKLSHAFLESVRHELPSQMEEQAYRFRSARLEEMGLPDFYESLSIFQPVSKTEQPASLQSRPLSRELGSSLVGWVEHAPLGEMLREAVSMLEPERAQIVTGDLILLANRTMVARRLNPGDRGSVRAALAEAAGYITLGLQSSGAVDASSTAALLGERDTIWIHRLGFTQLFRLQQRLRRVIRDGCFSLTETPLGLLSEPYRAPALALLNKRPAFVPWTESDLPQPARPFRSMAEVATAEEMIEELSLLPGAAELLFGAPLDSVDMRDDFKLLAPSLEEIRFEHFILSGIARTTMDSAMPGTPLSVRELGSFLGLVRRHAAESSMDGLVNSMTRLLAEGLGLSDENATRKVSHLLETSFKRLDRETGTVNLDEEIMPVQLSGAFLVG